MKFAIGLLLSLFAFAATGQSWPSRPMHLIVPFEQGGPTDLIGRTAAKILSDALGQRSRRRTASPWA